MKFCLIVMTIILQISFLYADTEKDQNINPSGIYLLDGGYACIVISNKQNEIWLNEHLPSRIEKYCKIFMEDGKLILERQFCGRELEQDNNKYTVQPEYREYIPSKNIRGDWDLIIFRPNGDLWPNVNYQIKTLIQPIHSNLHRINDSYVTEFFKNTDPERKYSLSKLLLERYPDDTRIKSLYLYSLDLTGKTKEMKIKLDEWKSEFLTKDNPYLEAIYYRSLDLYKEKILSSRGENVKDFMIGFFKPGSMNENRLSTIPRLLEYNKFMDMNYIFYFSMGSIIESETIERLASLEAIFHMIRGNNKEALKFISSAYHIGWILKDTYFSNRLWSTGIRVRKRYVDNFQFYVLNCCETDQEFEDLWKILESYHNPASFNETLEEVKKSVSYNKNIDTTFSNKYYESSSGNYGDIIWKCLADAKYELVIMTTSVKEFFLNNGRFPDNSGELKIPLSNPSVLDPFSSKTLKMKTGVDECICYSFGPDRKDDNAGFSYDPTNGLMSEGDVIIKVPRERTYPFPRGGLKADTPEDIRRIFPNGLPLDSFPDKNGEPLKISNTSPVMIISYGPDADTWKRKENVWKCPDIMYDPTNGVSSNGDLYITLPGK
jgi:hypothetical protein